jgi:hypothetical protein
MNHSVIKLLDAVDSLFLQYEIVVITTDENQQAPLKDPLHVPIGPLTRARSKKIKDVMTQFFYFLFFGNCKMSHHSGTTTCLSANIRYTFHNMYLIIRVTSTQLITHKNITNIAEGTSITTVNYNKRAINMSICLRLLYNY